MLKELSIDKNLITPAGLMNLSTILRNPTSALEFIHVTNDLINDEVVRSFANALAENNSLKRLIVDHYPYNKVTSYGYDAFTMFCVIPQASKAHSTPTTLLRSFAMNLLNIMNFTGPLVMRSYLC
jgi:hypothetical protein